MAGPFYVDPAVGSSGVGTSWATAYKTLLEATAVAAAGEIIYFSNATADAPNAATVTYTLNGCSIISTAGATNVAAVGATVSNAYSGGDINIQGVGYIYGVTFTPGTGATVTDISIAYTAADLIVAENCTFAFTGTGNCNFYIGNTGSSFRSRFFTKRCSVTFSSTGSVINLGHAQWESVADGFCASGTVPTYLFYVGDRATNSVFNGANVSAINTTLVRDAGGSMPVTVTFNSPKLNASFTPIASPAISGAEIQINDGMYDNAGTPTGLLFYHENYYGSTTISTAIYANDGLTIDGTNKCSWVVDGKSTATIFFPYNSPWLDVFNDDVSTAITPSFECVRSGSSTAYTDGEVWSELAYRGTANSPQYTLLSDRRVLTDSAVAQTTGTLDGSGWTGENATSWFGKLDFTSFTPAEIGHMRARVCVAGDNTVYVDPQLRGLA